MIDPPAAVPDAPPSTASGSGVVRRRPMSRMMMTVRTVTRTLMT